MSSSTVYYRLDHHHTPLPTDAAGSVMVFVGEDLLEDVTHRARVVTTFPGRYVVQVGEAPGVWFYETSLYVERLSDEGVWGPLVDLPRVRHATSWAEAEEWHKQTLDWVRLHLLGGGIMGLLLEARARGLCFAWWWEADRVDLSQMPSSHVTQSIPAGPPSVRPEPGRPEGEIVGGLWGTLA